MASSRRTNAITGYYVVTMGTHSRRRSTRNRLFVVIGRGLTLPTSTVQLEMFPLSNRLSIVLFTDGGIVTSERSTFLGLGRRTINRLPVHRRVLCLWLAVTPLTLALVGRRSHKYLDKYIDRDKTYGCEATP